MERTQFTFYESFYQALARIRKDSDRAKAYDALVRYALYGEEPDTDSLPDSAAMVFIMAMPNIDASRKKAEAGRKGGERKDEAKRKQTASKTEANAKQNASKTEAKPKREREQEREQEREREQMLLSPLTSSLRKFSPPSVEEVADYVREKGYAVDPEAFVAFYASKGWKVGAAPMKDWKAAVVTWARRERGETQKSPSAPDLGDLDRLYEELVENG